MSVPHGLEVAHNTLVAKYRENEVTIRALRKTLREDIIPNVLEEMDEEGVECDVRDLQEWANDTGVGLCINEGMTIITPQSHRIRLSYAQGLSILNRQSQVLRCVCVASRIHDLFHSPSSPHYASMADKDPLSIRFLHELSGRPEYVQDVARWLQRPPWPPNSRVQPCRIFRVSLGVLG